MDPVTEYSYKRALELRRLATSMSVLSAGECLRMAELLKDVHQRDRLIHDLLNDSRLRSRAWRSRVLLNLSTVQLTSPAACTIAGMLAWYTSPQAARTWAFRALDVDCDYRLAVQLARLVDRGMDPVQALGAIAEMPLAELNETVRRARAEQPGSVSP